MGLIKGLICQAIFSLPFMTIEDHCMEGAITNGMTINTQKIGLVADSDFYIPAMHNYALMLRIVTPNINRENTEELIRSLKIMDDLTGRLGIDPLCSGTQDYSSIPEKERYYIGKPLPLKIIITDKKTGHIVFNQIIKKLCTTGRGAYSYRHLLELNMRKGQYHFQAYTITPNPDFAVVESSLILWKPFLK